MAFQTQLARAMCGLVFRLLSILVLAFALFACGRVHVGQTTEAQEAQTKTPDKNVEPPEPNAGRRNRNPTEPAPALTIDLEKPPEQPAPEQ